MESDTIYRVIYSPTAFAYVVSPDGVGAYWYDSRKQVIRNHGEGLPEIILSYAEFEALRGAA